MKKYSFLQEFQAQEILSTAQNSMPYVNGAFGSFASLTGIKSSISKNEQDSFNAKYMELLFTDMCKISPKNRTQALYTLSKYTVNIDKLLAPYCKDKKTQLMCDVCKKFMTNNFYTPLKIIISDLNSPDWKNKTLQYIHKNAGKINFSNRIGKLYSLTRSTALGIGSLGLMGVASPAVAAAATATGLTLYALGSIKRNLRFFTGHVYINKMIKELNNCPDNDRQLAIKIVEKYCYNISNYIESQIEKTKKRIPFSVQTKMRAEFLEPLCSIINNQNNKYWKMQIIEYIKDKKIENAIQNISQTALDLLMPLIMRK